MNGGARSYAVTEPRPAEKNLRPTGEDTMLSKTIDVDGLNIFYREAGKPDQSKLLRNCQNFCVRGD
jgi:hypothetical protein